MQYFAIDTMKDSRDSHTLTQDAIDIHIDTVASLRPTHITVDCFMDWPDQFKMWVDSIRRYKLPIIFRLNWWGWQYYGRGTFNGVPVVDVTPRQYLTKTTRFITDNLDYFQDGDIFDACAEFEGGDYWRTYPEPRFQDPTMRSEFNNALLNMFDAFAAAFAGLNIIANHCSHTPGTLTSGLLFEATALQHRWITPDGYPDNGKSTPAEAVVAWLGLLDALHTKYPTKKIFITEMGYTLSVTSDTQQAEILRRELTAISAVDYVVGICYWVGCGYVGDVELFTRPSSNSPWRPREAARCVASFFANKGRIGRIFIG